MSDDVERAVNAPPPELRFGLRRLEDNELLAYGTTASLRRLLAVLGVDLYRVVRLARKRRKR